MQNDLFDKGKKKKKQSVGRDYPLSPTPNSTAVTYNSKPSGLTTVSVDTFGYSGGAKRFPLTETFNRKAVVGGENIPSGKTYNFTTNRKGAENAIKRSLGQPSGKVPRKKN